MNGKKELSTDNYKGVRDFYPEDMFVQKYIFDTMRRAVERFGYVEYGASILEPTELYKAKSGEEIVNDQTYSFKDRGERDVTLRPEMTPTVARMVAAKKRELSFPLRWYSIPNLFRYEKPQRGRLREHWQLNVDLFGVSSLEGEKEVIAAAFEIMRSFGAGPNDFEIKISSRKVLDYVFQEIFGLNPEKSLAATKLLDKKNKIPAETFDAEIKKLLDKNVETFTELFGKRNVKEFKAVVEKKFNQQILGIEEIEKLIEELRGIGVDNAVFDPTLTRGFDYYTGIVFEVFDTNNANPRALFGGGRYDDLLSIFGSERVSAIGFGMGDVTLKDFLEVRGLVPTYASTADLYIARAEGTDQKEIDILAKSLRYKGLSVAVDFSGKKIGEQIKKAVKDAIPYLIVIGESEIASKKYELKHLPTEESQSVGEMELVKIITESRVKRT